MDTSGLPYRSYPFPWLKHGRSSSSSSESSESDLKRIALSPEDSEANVSQSSSPTSADMPLSFVENPFPGQWFSCTLRVSYFEPTYQIISSQEWRPQSDWYYGAPLRGEVVKRFDESIKIRSLCHVRARSMPPTPQRILFDAKNIKNLLNVSYEFKRGLFKYLEVTDLAHALSAFGFKLTQKEKEKYLNPVSAITQLFPALGDFMRSGWRLTILGGDVVQVTNSIINPTNGAKKFLQKSASGSTYGFSCTMVFTAPTDLFFEEDYDFMELFYDCWNPAYSIWSCSRFNMAALLEDFHLVMDDGNGHVVGHPHKFGEELGLLAHGSAREGLQVGTECPLPSSFKYLHLHRAPSETKIKRMRFRRDRRAKYAMAKIEDSDTDTILQRMLQQ